MRKLKLSLSLCVLLAAGVAQAQEVTQSRGVDAQVNYAELTKFGPWDDRNYQLTAKDLEILPAHEHTLHDPVPAFFRVEMRKWWKENKDMELRFYPRSALQIFKKNFGGYMIEGTLYRKVTKENGRYRVIMEEGLAEEDFRAGKMFAGEVRVTTPEGAAESSVKISPVDPNIVVAGSNGPGSSQIMHYSSDAGATWTQAAALPLGGTCCDPTIDFKDDGSLVHTSTLGNCGFGGCEIWTYRSSDNGQTWNDLEADTPGDPRREVSTDGASDKEFIHTDKFATSPHINNVYLTWHSGNVMQFARSTDDGDNWTTTTFGADPRGIGSDITTDKNGVVYYFWPSLEGGTSSRVVLKRSNDGGATFPAGVTTVANLEDEFDFAIPIMETRRVFIYVAADVDYTDGPFANSIYASWTDATGPEQGAAANNHARIQVAYSRDGGDTWNTSTPHSTADQDDVDRFHQWLAVDESGNVHVVYYDTRLDPNRQNLDFYHTVSTDGAVTWSDPERLTSVSSGNPADGFEWGDYNGLDVVMGQAIAVFTDNRSETGGGGDSLDIYAIGKEVEGGVSPEIFSDGFESGDTAPWDITNSGN
ncbi:MAG: sialidase family protein [Acidobacteriota bacterium]